MESIKGRKVWLVQRKEDLINFGLFETKEKAENYFNNQHDKFACIEIEIN